MEENAMHGSSHPRRNRNKQREKNDAAVATCYNGSYPSLD